MIFKDRMVVTLELESGELVTVIFSAPDVDQAVVKLQQWFPDAKIATTNKF